MIVENVLHRPIRTLVSILAVAIEVGMVMLVVGMTHGLLNEYAKRVEGVGADVMIQPPNASFFFGLSSAPMPVKIADRLAELPHVLAVTPVLFQSYSTGGVPIIVYGIDMPSWNRVTGGFVYLQGGPFRGPNDILVDDIYARDNHIRLGQTLNVYQDFQVVGIVEHGKGSRLFIPLATAQDMAGAHDKASIFYVKCVDPAYTDSVIASVRQLLPNYTVLSIKQFMTLVTSNDLPALTAFITALIAVAVCIGFLVIFLSMYTTITERTREIGILKSLGASKAYIIQVILREAALLCLVGIVAGIVGTIVAARVIQSSFPTISVDLTPLWGLRAAALALAGALLGAFYPAFRAARLDPVDALAYE